MVRISGLGADWQKGGGLIDETGVTCKCRSLRPFGCVHRAIWRFPLPNGRKVSWGGDAMLCHFVPINYFFLGTSCNGRHLANTT